MITKKYLTNKIKACQDVMNGKKVDWDLGKEAFIEQGVYENLLKKMERTNDATISYQESAMLCGDGCCSNEVIYLVTENFDECMIERNFGNKELEEIFKFCIKHKT